MILEKIENKEYHPNGNIWIEGTWAIIAPLWKHLFNYRVAEDGKIWCRIGIWTKHYNNGQLAWKLEYDEYGNYIKNDNSVQYREDGTQIVY